MSKVVDKVWHAGLIYKLRQNGVDGDLVNIPNDFLTNRKQRVVLNGYCLSQVNIGAGVPQGSTLGPLCKLFEAFADDTYLISVAHGVNTSTSDISNDLKLISDRAFQWKMSFNSRTD